MIIKYPGEWLGVVRLEHFKIGTLNTYYDGDIFMVYLGFLCISWYWHYKEIKW
jgi:hypothetical protein